MNEPRGGTGGATIVEADALRAFTADVLCSYDVVPDHARLTADVLVRADLYGIDSHGVSRLPLYAHKLGNGLVNPDPRPEILAEAPAACLVDGDNGLGPVASLLAMDWCIDRARDTAVACATVRRSNHYGIAGYWALRAVPHGMIGVSMTNATVLVAPTFGRVPRFGTNPIAVAAPTRNGRPFLIDMATSAVSAGKLQLALAEGTSIPEGWAIDAQGDPTTDPLAGFQGALLPLGSTYERSSYKGYGLAVAVDVLCAVLSGASYGPHCLSLTSEFDSIADVGHFFMAMRVDAFRPLADFTVVMDEMVDGLHTTPGAPGAPPVRVPGDPEFDEEARRSRDGIPLDAGTVASLRRLADERGCTAQADRLLGA